MDGFTFFAAKPTEEYHKIDMWLLLSILLMWGIGIFTLFVSSQGSVAQLTKRPLQLVERQLICSAVGFLLFVFFLFLDMKVLKKLVAIIVIGSIILCILTYIPGLSVSRNGARRWIKVPGNFTFQPSELLKFSLVLFLANYFDKQSEIINPEEKTVFPCVICLVVFVLLVFFQKDFSTGIFIFLIGMLMFFVSGSKMLWVLPFMLIAIPAVFLMVSLESYRLERIIGFLKPDEFASAVNYQSLNAKKAISVGGFWGCGIGKGLKKINNIPEVQADFIFAGWVEAMGFLGVILYFILLGFFAWRGYRTSFKCPSRFSAYSCFGCVSIIFIQSLVNCMVVCGLLPTTGIPLPFFSSGGSSIIVTLAMCGFIVNSSRCEEINNENKIINDKVEIDTLTIL